MRLVREEKSNRTHRDLNPLLLGHETCALPLSNIHSSIKFSIPPILSKVEKSLTGSSLSCLPPGSGSCFGSFNSHSESQTPPRDSEPEVTLSKFLISRNLSLLNDGRQRGSSVDRASFLRSGVGATLLTRV